jgi:uncharacterized repeat protein (TIGR03803 family)
VLYNFTRGNDGANPASGVILDHSGNLYGTTDGATVNGTAYQLSPPAQQGGAWTLNLLHTFTDRNGDGGAPAAGLVFDAAGNLYGTAVGGGRFGSGPGIVYRLSPGAGGKWTETVYPFPPKNQSGLNPFAPLLFRNGLLYGTTFAGGSMNQGVVFQLRP